MPVSGRSESPGLSGNLHSKVSFNLSVEISPVLARGLGSEAKQSPRRRGFLILWGLFVVLLVGTIPSHRRVFCDWQTSRVNIAPQQKWLYALGIVKAVSWPCPPFPLGNGVDAGTVDVEDFADFFVFY